MYELSIQSSIAVPVLNYFIAIVYIDISICTCSKFDLPKIILYVFCCDKTYRPAMYVFCCDKTYRPAMIHWSWSSIGEVVSPIDMVIFYGHTQPIIQFVANKA